jgi:hypothetical protein
MATLTKRERQDAKLTLAGTDRVARNVIEPGRYTNVTADATQLPTRYAVGDNNTNNLVINPNISGLLPGRPWNSTTSVYAILAFEPKLVFDFTGNVFKTGGADSTLANSVTHARAGQATMVDSDGLLKWAPHNLLPYSLLVHGSGWTQQNATLTLGATTAPDGTSNASSLVESTTTITSKHQCYSTGIVTEVTTTYSIWIKANTRSEILVSFATAGQAKGAFFNLLTGEVGTVYSGYSASIVEGVDGWYRCSVTFTPSSSGTYYPAVMMSVSEISSYIGDGTSGVYLWGAHAYRSDLGGMVNNSATGNSYVPTTSSAVYAPRVGHHVYNGSAWVNEGILHESEARTNLCNHSDNPANWLSNPSGSFTFTAAQAVGSDGTLSLTKVAIGNTSTTEHEIYTTHSSINPSLGMTLSAELKSGDQRYVMLRQYIDANDWFAVTFDLVTGVVTQESVGSTGSVSIQSSGVIDLSNGLYRCWVSYIDISNTSSAGFPTIDAVTSGTPTLASNGSEPYSGTVGTHFYLGKMQLEQGSTPSSYIPTSGSTVTRPAETLTVPAANLPYDSTNMSIQIDGKMTYADTGADNGKLIRWEKDVANKLWVALDSAGSSTGSLYWVQRSLGVSDFTSSLPQFSPGTNVTFNLSSRHGSTFLNAAAGGTAGIADTTPTSFPDLSASNLSLGHNLMGTIGQFRMWDEDLTDAGIVEATEPSTEPSLQLTFDGSSTNSFTVLDWSE